MGKENFGNGFITAGTEPGGTEIAAADVHRYRHVGGFGGENLIEARHIKPSHAVDVNAARCVGRAFFRRAEFAPARVVQLQVAAASGVEREHGVNPAWTGTESFVSPERRPRRLSKSQIPPRTNDFQGRRFCPQ